MNVTCVLGLALLLTGCGSRPGAEAPQAEAKKDSNQVSVDKRTQSQVGIEIRPVKTQSLESPIYATGQLQLNEDRTWHVGAVAEGKVTSLLIKLGEHVRKGQVLAEMHSHDVHDSRAARKQALDGLQRTQAVSEQAMRVRNRTERLFNLKAASREQMEAAETQYKSAQLMVSDAQAELKKTEQHLTEFLDVPLEDVESDAPGTGGDGVPIKSPAAGIVMDRHANVGSVVSIGEPVITVSDVSSLWLIASVNESDLARVRIGQTVRVSVRAYPDRTFSGRVFQLGERLDPQTRTLQVRVLVVNVQSQLKPDMFANAEFTPETSKAVIYVPEAAVQNLEGKQVVFVRTASGAFAPKQVKIGVRANGELEVLNGLTNGMQVVVKGAFLLKSQMSNLAEE